MRNSLMSKNLDRKIFRMFCSSNRSYRWRVRYKRKQGSPRFYSNLWAKQNGLQSKKNPINGPSTLDGLAVSSRVCILQDKLHLTPTTYQFLPIWQTFHTTQALVVDFCSGVEEGKFFARIDRQAGVALSSVASIPNQSTWQSVTLNPT